jgi:hypothetical protein
MTGPIITNSTTGGNLISLNTTSTTQTATILLKNNLPIFGYLGLGCSGNSTNYASNLFLETNYDIIINSGGYSTTPKMIIKSNGNVGIGTTNPQYKLQVGKGFLKLGDGVKTLIGVRDDDDNEDGSSGTNTRIVLYTIESSSFSGYIQYFAPGLHARHIFYANYSTMFSINHDGSIRGAGNNLLFDINGNLYKNNTLIDFASYATKTIDIINTSNYTTNISNILNSKIETYTLERQYPPKQFNTSTGETPSSGEILNVVPLNYIKESITLTTDGINYGSGRYELYSSSAATSLTRVKTKLFNYTIGEVECDWGLNYNIVNGNQLNNRYIKSDYFGEWSIIKFPNPFILTSYVISVDYSIPRWPALWRLYGSNDGVNWYDIKEAEVSIPLTSSSYQPSNKYEKVLNISFNSPYLYIGIVFNRIIGDSASSGNSQLSLQELRFFGKEEIKLLTEERQYPPKQFNTVTNETTTTEILGKTNYKQIITLNTVGITYGSGEYIIYSSSFLTTYENDKKNLFDYVLSSDNGVHWNADQYSSSGIYIKNPANFIVSEYTGDWVILKCPNPIILTKYNIIARNTFISRAPGEWKCYGSNDGIAFTEITEASQITRLSEGNYSDFTYTKSFNNLIPYLYIGFTFNKLAGNQPILNFNEIQLFGREFKNYQSDWNSTIINKPDLTVYATKTIDIINTSNYTRIASNVIIDNSSNFTLGTSNILRSLINSNLIASSNYTRIASNILRGDLLNLSGGIMTGNISFQNANTFIHFGTSRGDSNLIRLWGTSYSFGLGDRVLRYNTDNVGSHKFYAGTTNTATINEVGMLTILSNIDCGGGLALTGAIANYSFSQGTVDSSNILNTYISFKPAGSSDDWCYLRQIGTPDAIKLAFDFHDNIDARFCIRSIISTSNPDRTIEVFTVDNGNVTATSFSGVGSNLTNINYNNITTNKLSFQSPLSSNASTNVISIDLTSTSNYTRNVSNILRENLLNLSGGIMTGALRFNNLVQNKVISLYDAATPNNFQFIGIGANNGLILNTFGSGDAFQFRVGASATTSTELMRLSGTGNLGIGTDGPAYKLHIRNTSPSIVRIETDSEASINQISGIEFGIPFLESSGSSKITSRTYDFNMSDLQFNTGWVEDSGGQIGMINPPVSTLRMIILGNGNVGIGTSIPSSKLHIEHSSTTFNAANAGLYVYNPNNISSHCSVLGARLAGTTASKVGVSLDVKNGYGWSMYLVGSDTTQRNLRFNSSWDTAGLDRLQIRGNDGYATFLGSMQIGSGTTNASLIIGNSTNDTSITLTDMSTAVWKIGTGGYNLTFSNDSPTGGTFISKMIITKDANLLVRGDISAFANMSDRRLKHNINNLSLNCIDLLNKITPVEFIWNDMTEIIEIKRNTLDHGFIAQDIELLLPNLVNQYEKYKSIKYEKLTPYLVKGSQELYKLIQELQEDNIRQKNQIFDLQNQINMIKQYMSLI